MAEPQRVEDKTALLLAMQPSWKDKGLFDAQPPAGQIVVGESMASTRQSQMMHRAQITNGGQRPRK